MIELTKQIIDFYFKNNKEATISDLNISNKILLETKAPIFVTLYKKGEIRGASGSISENKENIIEELIENVYNAMKNDSRFDKITEDEVSDLKIRIDKITERKVITKNELKNQNPVNFGVITIKKDYSKIAVILPNISHKIDSGKDYSKILSKKLDEKFEFENYIVYQIQTEVESDF